MEIESLLNRATAADHGSLRRRIPIGISHSAPVSPKPTIQRNVYTRSLKAVSAASEEPASSQEPRKMMPHFEPTLASNIPARAFHPDASLVLVGIRGSGKRSLGFIAATALGRRFITEDHYFQSTTGLSRQDYLKIHGSQEFHKRDVEVLRRMLDENKSKCVIECGLGSLTTSVQDYLKEYSLTNPVLYLIRDMGEIKRLLRLADRSARLLENGDPTHRRCSNFEFYNLEDHTTESPSDSGSPDRWSPTYSFKLKDVKEDFSYFVRFITGASTYRPNHDSPFSLLDVPVDLRLYTHALEVRFSEYENGKVDFAQLESGGDVVEICVDRWSPKSTNLVSKMVAEARRKVAVPIVFSASRTHPSVNNDMYVAILEHGLRLGVEFLSVDLDLHNNQIAAFVVRKGFTRIIGHILESSPTGVGWDHDEWIQRYNRAEMLGCDMVRLLRVASSRDDNETLTRFTEKIRGRGGLSPPLIAYNVGPLGRTSQVFNPILTSVTHLAFRESSVSQENRLGPQITSQEAVQALFQSFVLDPLTFYILGANVSSSLSPAMHNAAYHVLGMNHTYTVRNIVSLTELEELARNPQFGGASIVQPWKVAVFGELASKSRHAEAIGAVNTLLPLREDANGTVPPLQIQANQRNRAGRVAAWYGDNTDWIGIMVCVNRNLSPRNVILPLKTTGLVIGAGGMARGAVYAMLKLGCRNVFIYNRTVSNAEAVALHFNTWAASANGGQETTEFVRVLRSLDDLWPANFAMPTMIVSCVTQENLNGRQAANFELPQNWLQSPSGGVVVEMAYQNTDTTLIKQIKRLRKDTGVPWVLVDGLETLPEQAIAQFELMTGRKAPRGRMRDEIIQAFRQRQIREAK